MMVTELSDVVITNGVQMDGLPWNDLELDECM